MTGTVTELGEKVRAIVGEALALEPDEVIGDATLLNDLGAESIDLLDILFRIERSFGVRIEAAELADYVQGGIPDEEFGDADEMVSERGMAQLLLVMPQLETGARVSRIKADEVMGLFTVDNLEQLVRSRLGAAGPAGG
ncbi:acyl carrier protein [Lentzea atacamensis]|uniref:Acyl carrier protein n=1 Tax=Lentzea atacamensis TaxID=531938 RepID=A0ABX9EAS8_9PSEU|nr:phosphopantetheine-binding protein [Lentzea atacamensis]RAS65880.1 acyl carrier protein [Lentzea atacamensis]